MLKVERIDEHKDAEEPEEVVEERITVTRRCGFHNNFLYTNLCEKVFRNYDLRHSF